MYFGARRGQVEVNRIRQLGLRTYYSRGLSCPNHNVKAFSEFRGAPRYLYPSLQKDYPRKESTDYLNRRHDKQRKADARYQTSRYGWGIYIYIYLVYISSERS